MPNDQYSNFLNMSNDFSGSSDPFAGLGGSVGAQAASAAPSQAGAGIPSGGFAGDSGLPSEIQPTAPGNAARQAGGSLSGFGPEAALVGAGVSSIGGLYDTGQFVFSGYDYDPDIQKQPLYSGLYYNQEPQYSLEDEIKGVRSGFEAERARVRSGPSPVETGFSELTKGSFLAAPAAVASYFKAKSNKRKREAGLMTAEAEMNVDIMGREQMYGNYQRRFDENQQRIAAEREGNVQQNRRNLNFYLPTY